VVEFSSPAAAKLYFANSCCPGRVRLAVAERGYSLRYTDPEAMLAWCEAAAFNLPPSLPASEAGVLLAYLGNAHRVSCNFVEAEDFLQQALAVSPGDPLILEFYSALMKDTGRLATAAEFLSRASKMSRGQGDRFTPVIALLEFAVVLGEAGLPKRATDSVLEALELIGSMPDSDERERLARSGFQNLAKSLVDAGKPQAALWVVSLCKEGLLQGGELYRLRLDWLMADITGALGDLDNAVVMYKKVREQYTAPTQLRERALVTLDLARLLLKPRPVEAREEALSVWPILEGLGIARDAREAKLLAAVVEKGSEAALVELAAALRTKGLPWPSPGSNSRE
jgi:tetratricopeptide (TPR) repeat protein